MPELDSDLVRGVGVLQGFLQHISEDIDEGAVDVADLVRVLESEGVGLSMDVELLDVGVDRAGELEEVFCLEPRSLLRGFRIVHQRLRWFRIRVVHQRFI